MNGGVMEHEESAFVSKKKLTSGQHYPEYHPQNHFVHVHASPDQPNKAMNHQLSNPSILKNDLPEHLLSKKTNKVAYQNIVPSENCKDPRQKVKRYLRIKPLDLPVPKFEIDENCVSGSHIFQCDQKQNIKDLDLDTRIGLLIKSKALAGVHPIFSELEESTSDSDEPFSREIKSMDLFRHTTSYRSPPKNESFGKSFDDPEKPLSRPPSPFLSRATYLCWFNKAIELKHHAKAQEKALLDAASKGLLKEHVSTVKINKSDSFHQEENYMMKHVLNEVSNEFIEIFKQEFVNEVLEKTIISSVENWWEEEKYKKVNKRNTMNIYNDIIESFPSYNVNEYDTDKSKTDPVDQECSDRQLPNNIEHMTEENMLNSAYLENTNNIKDLLYSLDRSSDMDLKKNVDLNLLRNVYQSKDHVTNMTVNNQIVTSRHISNAKSCDFIRNTSEPVEHDAVVVKNVLNFILDNIDRTISENING